MAKQLKSCVVAAVFSVVGVLSAWAEVPLPDDYVQLDWIRSTSGGQQYINTEYMPLASDVVTCVVDVDNAQTPGSKYATVFGAKVNNASNAYAFFSHNGNALKNSPAYCRNSGAVSGTEGSFTCGRKTMIVCNSATARWWPVDQPEKISTLTFAATVNCENYMYIFTENIGPVDGSSLASSTWNTMKLYSFTIETDDGTKVRDFVPCRNPDGKCGLWEKVIGKFHPNANASGAEDFHGSDEVDVFVSYINSTSGGNQYLNTKYTAKADDVVTCVVDVEKDGNGKYAAVFGSKVKNVEHCYSFFTHNNSTSGSTPVYGRGSQNKDHASSDWFTFGQRTTLVCDSGSARWCGADGVERSTVQVTTTLDDCRNNMYVFTENTGPENGSGIIASTMNTMKLYSFKIKSNDTVVRDLRPYRTADGRLGAYDVSDHSGEAGYDPLYLNAGTGAAFGWGGVAYALEDNGATIVLREGTLSDFDIEGYSLVKKSAFTPVTAAAVTDYPALELTQGKFVLQDGVAKTYTVANALTLTGGARLAIDLSATGNDSFTVGAIDLSAASAENPVVVEINPVGVTALGVDEVRPLISGAGLALELADGDAQKFRVKGFAAQVAVRDGSVVLIKTDPEDAVWTGEAAPDTTWSNADNWEVAPETGANVRFNLSAGGTTTLDQPYAVKNVIFGADAGAFTHGGTDVLSVQAGIENASASAQTFSMPMALGTAGVPFTFAATGDLALTDGIKTPVADEFVKTGAGTLALNDDTVSAAAKVTVSNGTLRLVNTGKTTAAATAGEIRIADGARLDVNVDGGNSANLAKTEATHGKTVYVEGSGPNGESAIINSNPANAYGANFGRLVATGDAKVGGSGRIGVRPLPGSQIPGSAIEGAGTLHILGAGAFEQGSDQVSVTSVECAIGGIVVERGGYFQFDGSVNGTVTNGVTLADGSFMRLYQSTVSAGIPIVVPAEASAVLKSAYRDSTLAGAMRVDGELTTQNKSGATLALTGTLSGNGSLKGDALVFSGSTSRWEMSADDSGFTEKVNIEDQPNANLFAGLHEIAVTYTGNPAEKHDFEIGPAGALTATAAAKIVLSVRDAQDTAIPNCWLGIANGKLILHLNDTEVVRTAVWTGLGVDPNNLTDPANWTCTNDGDFVVDGGLPMSATTVIIPGENCTFNCPADAVLTCREITFTYPVTLAADCDWRGLDVAITNTVDLCGHKLYVSDLKGTGTITDSTECYQPVEYIQSTGSQYINTLYRTNPDDRIVCTAEIATSGHGDYGILFGAIRENKTDYNDAYAVFVADGKANTAVLKYCRSNYRKDAFANGDKTRGKKITIDCRGRTATWTDGTTTGTATVPDSANLGNQAVIPLVIFNFNKAASGDVAATGDSTKCAAKLYSFQIYNAAGELQRDFVPMRKLPGGEGVLYDRVEKKRYENAGSGTFVVGPATESVQAGELHFDVPSGTKSHSEVLLAGAVRLVKDGAGTLTLSMQNQTYNGGTDVTAGTVVAGGYGNSRIYGAAGSTVWVRKGATFDIKGYYNQFESEFVLDGGTITGAGNSGNGRGWFQHVVLTDDSKMTGQNIGIVNGGNACTLEMNGHTLTVEVTAYGQDFYMGNLVVTGGGRIVGNAGGWLKLGASGDTNGKYVHAETTTLEVPNIGTKCMSTDVRFAGYVANYLGGNTSTDKGLITVMERFMPIADTATWYDTLLKDGVTMDLSRLTKAFNTTCTYETSGGSRTVTFDEDAETILVDLGDRRVRSGAQVISWLPENAPAETVKFKLAPGQSGMLRRTATGVEYRKGMTIIFR